MTCTACGGDIELDAAFCGICGSKLRARRTTLVGAVFAGDYRIDQKIAEGGFGTIYQATHIPSGLDCALKVLHAELAADESLAARFRREGATLSRLHDPHTVATYDVGEAPDGTLYIAMELLRGESLHDRLVAESVIPWRTTLGIIRQLCSALAEAHDLGIVHRDLKPANIHLAANDTVKLLDFGIAKITGGELDGNGELTRLGQTVGTLEYMAPEQIIGGSCEPRSDIYQLGVLMFEMITGRRPFGGSAEPTAMITALLTQTPPEPSSVFAGTLPAALDALILRCLEREPEDRFTNVRELVAAIVKLLGTTEAAAMMVMYGEGGDEATWIGDQPMFAAVYAAPSLVPIGPPEVTQMAPFDISVRGSVTEGMPLESTGNVAALEAYAVEPMPPALPPPPPRTPSGSVAPYANVAHEPVSPFERTAPAPALAAPVAPAVPRRMSFAARVVLWTAGLAAIGAALGAGIGVLIG